MQTTPQLGHQSLIEAESERIRAMIMNIHGMLQGTDAAHSVAVPIEHIHCALDRTDEKLGRR